MATSVEAPTDKSGWSTPNLNRLADAVTELQGIANGGSQTVLPASNGSDDTAALNTILAAGGNFAGKNGETYRLSSALILPSNTQLDLRGCTLKHNAGSSFNLLNNSAVASVRRILDAVTTGTSTTFTSATAAFTSADIGKTVTIQGAGTASAPHTTTIASVTNGTTAVLTLAAVTSVTGQYAAIGTRDSNITLIGGFWDRSLANAGNNFTDHIIRFRHVDNLNIIGPMRFSSVNGKYAINPGDCTRVTVSDPDFTGHSSDGVHLNGPCQFVTIRNPRALAMHDDLVSLTARDSTVGITDCAGDITDVVIHAAAFNAITVGGLASALKLIGGKTTDASRDYALRRIVARDLTAPTAGAAVIYLGDSAGGVFDDMLFDGVRSLGGSGKGPLQIHGGTSVDRIIARDLVPDPADSWAVDVDTSVSRLEVDGVTWTCTTNSNAVLVAAGTIDKLIITNAQISLTGGGALVRVNNGATVTTVALSNNTMAGGGASAQSVAGGNIGQVNVNGLIASTCTYPLGVYNGITTITATNVTATGVTNWFLVQGSGNVTVTSLAGLSADANVLANTTMTGAFQFGIYFRATLAYSASMTPDLVTAAWQTVTVTNGTAMTINAPIHPPPAGQTTDLTIEIFNNSGGAMGVITWNGAFVFQVGAFVNPATGKRRNVVFRWSGNSWIQISPVGTDY